MPTGEEESRLRFRDGYGLESDVLVEIEREVIGGDDGANGYTTRAQADDIAARLRLDGGTRVLDIGTGRGWPALCFARPSVVGLSRATCPSRGWKSACVVPAT